jgi:urocanate hydratase
MLRFGTYIGVGVALHDGDGSGVGVGVGTSCPVAVDKGWAEAVAGIVWSAVAADGGAVVRPAKATMAARASTATRTAMVTRMNGSAGGLLGR